MLGHWDPTDRVRERERLVSLGTVLVVIVSCGEVFIVFDLKSPAPEFIGLPSLQLSVTLDSTTTLYWPLSDQFLCISRASPEHLCGLVSRRWNSQTWGAWGSGSSPLTHALFSGGRERTQRRASSQQHPTACAAHHQEIFKNSLVSHSPAQPQFWRSLWINAPPRHLHGESQWEQTQTLVLKLLPHTCLFQWFPRLGVRVEGLL